MSACIDVDWLRAKRSPTLFEEGYLFQVNDLTPARQYVALPVLQGECDVSSFGNLINCVVKRGGNKSLSAFMDSRYHTSG